MAKMKGILTQVQVLSAFSADFQDKQSGKTIEYYQLHGYQAETREFLKLKLAKEQLGLVQSFVGQTCDVEVETDTNMKSNPLLCRIHPVKVKAAA